MDPLTLLAVVAAAGFFFNKSSSQSSKNHKHDRRELTYSKTVVAQAKKYSPTDFDLSSIEVLPEYKLVQELINKNFPLIFVTGGAGTGKSTFIRWLLKEFNGAVLLGAPTAMAAINIEGKTLHSLCQLPPAWIVKKDIKKTPGRGEIVQAKLLIIDEISMVTSNLLDGVSAYFKANRDENKPFGGISVIMVGDMFQLPPVVSRETKELFERVYGSAKFYNAKCLQQATYYAVELQKTFRQVDQSFVDILTRLREGVDVPNALDELNHRCEIVQNPPIGAVWLSPRNSEVDHRNQEELEKIKEISKFYIGEIQGNFKVDRLPSPKKLELKCGAQVMFTKNDPQKRWINGTIGIVKKLDDYKIVVEIYGEILVDVGIVTWNEYQYMWSETTATIERNITGSYSQFPLVLAWSMTIHKSQGRTIEKVHIDLGSGAFETGQSYVALSRCRSIEGLSLTRKLVVGDILVDQESKEFYDQLRLLIKNLPPEQLMKSLSDPPPINQ